LLSFVFNLVLARSGINKVGIAFAVILPLLTIIVVAYGAKRYIERERILWLAETWDDEEFNEKYPPSFLFSFLSSSF
jgi:hypothetical protein